MATLRVVKRSTKETTPKPLAKSVTIGATYIVWQDGTVQLIRK